ncbi:uncharacterized protein MONOS_1450 [Monocercomonoides exilis]|uniref:uncharacterized protein n=1 Tax=Monocercomonoides exilis TaxID=2049356 RepID=UPI0035593FE4|nr:hypothetical protein MONOS_1450 [Monocercomonoides exilis]|eukprot:MONOS_1450.1-p1 / transcript=MONOS_1450.1 / gene=MONOS_1450 / organism=Monocercomonoides_exilis_PA203 / gene_product=unspecified product / transcript_product=unspecified product / location=Mono_scaffold00026:6432-8360(-) / protein_length=643 / sequence_SO=supercontig / SO=protein_coding / is_pseudo=false
MSTKLALTTEDVYGVSGQILYPVDNRTPKSSNPILTTPRNAYDTPTAFSQALRTYDMETLAPYTQKGIPVDEVKKKSHAWAFGMYTLYCERFKKEPWPVDGETMYGFVKLIGTALNYSLKSIRDSIIPSLYYLSWYRTKTLVNSEVRKLVLLAESEVQFQRNEMFEKGHYEKAKCVSKHKEPLIVPDLNVILSSIPDWFVEKPREASLFLFALATGARSHTCSKIRLMDIVRVFVNNSSTFVKVTINLACGKGVRNDDHCVTVEGNITEKHTLNVIWWLEEFLVQEYGLSLTKYDKWNLGRMGVQFLWGLRKGAMRARLQKRSFQAGYPSQLFGFHSLRSGFISSAFLKIGNKPELKENVLETAAFVAKWKPGSQVEVNYVDKTSRSTIIANRINYPDEVLEGDELFCADLSNPTVFHNITMGKSQWNDDGIIETFSKFVIETLKLVCKKFHYPYQHITKLNRIAAERFLKLNGIDKVVKAKGIQASKDFVLKQLKDKKGDIVSIGLQYVNTIKEYLEGTVRLHVSGKEIRKKVRESRRRNLITNTSARIKWTTTEDKTLIAMFLEKKTYKEMSNALSFRSANSCRDRIRNIVKTQRKKEMLSLKQNEQDEQDGNSSSDDNTVDFCQYAEQYLNDLCSDEDE